MKKGIDISYWQRGLKIADVKKAGFEFVIIRGSVTSYGNDRPISKDTAFEDFYAQCKAEKMPCGVYHYSCANTYQGGADEAKFLYENCLKGKQFEYPIYIDVEDQRWQETFGAGATQAIIGFGDTLEKLGYFVGVYSSLYWFNSILKTNDLSRFTKWVACWSKAKPNFRFNAFDMWQNTNENKIGNFTVDGDEAYKDFPTIIKNAGLNGCGKTVETPKQNTTTEKPKTTTKKKSTATIAKEVIAGKWGVGEDRKKKLTEAGYDYGTIQKAVDELMKPKKSVDEIAKEVIAGKWGVGAVRKSKLTAAGYDYATIQKRVDELMKK